MMKRLIALLLACLLVVPCAFAEDIDLSSLSFIDLVILKERISQELTTRPEWKSVPVPPGLYQVGVDIPAGDWCLKCADSSNVVNVTCGTKLNDTRTDVDGGFQFYGLIYKEDDGSNTTQINAVLYDGLYIRVQFGSVLFTTPEKVTLGF